MAEIEEGAAVVGAGVAVHISYVGTRSVLIAVLVEEMMRGNTATMKGVGGREAVALEGRGAVVEALQEGGIEVQLERAVLKGELRLSNGTGKRSRRNLEVRQTMEVVRGMTMAMLKMEISTLTLSRSRWLNSIASAM